MVKGVRMVEGVLPAVKYTPRIKREIEDTLEYYAGLVIIVREGEYKWVGEKAKILLAKMGVVGYRKEADGA